MTYYYSNHFIFKVFNNGYYYDVDNLKKFNSTKNDSSLYYGRRLKMENVFYSSEDLL